MDVCKYLPKKKQLKMDPEYERRLLRQPNGRSPLGNSVRISNILKSLIVNRNLGLKPGQYAIKIKLYFKYKTVKSLSLRLLIQAETFPCFDQY